MQSGCVNLFVLTHKLYAFFNQEWTEYAVGVNVGKSFRRSLFPHQFIHEICCLVISVHCRPVAGVEHCALFCYVGSKIIFTELGIVSFKE